MGITIAKCTTTVLDTCGYWTVVQDREAAEIDGPIHDTQSKQMRYLVALLLSTPIFHRDTATP